MAERRATHNRDLKEKAGVALSKDKVKLKPGAILLDTTQRWLQTVKKAEASAIYLTHRLCNKLDDAKKNCSESLHKVSYMKEK